MSASTLQLMSRRRKAAMVVQMMLSSGGKMPLSSLPETMQANIAKELGALRATDRETVSAVADEFLREMSAIGLLAPGTPDRALQALSEHLSPELAERLRLQMSDPNIGDPWIKLAALDVTDFIPIMEQQSIEICAVVLSKLPVAKAAELLVKLPGEQARRITYAVSQTSNIAPAAVARIGRALVQDYCGKAVVAFTKPADKRVGAILNSCPSDIRDLVLAGLVDEDAEFAGDVRKAIFTFADIATRIQAIDIPNCIRGVDQDVLITAIAAALAWDAPYPETAEFILTNISQRMAGQIREEAAEKGTIRKAEAETAMSDVTRSIRELVDAGTITMIDPEANKDDE